ncbi:MAG: DUF1801 domain-containing protein [Fimbriimonadaceae bacterium]|nr:DUF1801 domain-containing protein [Fimbriimonadaceae bacterium]
MRKGGPTTVDEYLAEVPSEDARRTLERLRAIVRDEAPDAEETMSYGMPAYTQNGPVVYFAAFKNHCSLFPGTTTEEFADALAGYKTSKGTIQFTPDRPLPEDLVRTIVRRRLEVNAEAAAKRPARRSRGPAR